MPDRTRDDVLREAAAMAHDDAFASDKKAARALGCSRRSANRYSHEGHPAARRFARYVQRSNNPERVVAFARALLHQHVASMTRTNLIDAYRSALLSESGVEAEDRLHDIDGSPWMIRAESSQADAAVDELKAAIELELEARYRRDPRAYAPDVIMLEVIHG